MLWEIDNPSDPYTIAADDFEVAALAVILLRKGAYGLSPICTTPSNLCFPILLGADEEDLNRVWQERFGHDFCLGGRAGEVAVALESVLIGRGRDRFLFSLAIDGKSEDEAGEIWEHYHDERRTSMNDIGRKARRLAGWLRDSASRIGAGREAG